MSRQVDHYEVHTVNPAGRIVSTATFDVDAVDEARAYQRAKPSNRRGVTVFRSGSGGRSEMAGLHGGLR